MGDAVKYAYVARDPRCGCIVAAMVDSPSLGDDLAREVGSWVLRGLRVKRVKPEEAVFGGCPICRPAVFVHEAGQEECRGR